jgi:phage gp45-like
VHIKKGKIIEVEGDTFNFKCKNFNVSADNFNLQAAGAIAMQSNTFGVAAAGGSKIEGNLSATGGITDSKGSMQGMRDTFNAHTNNGQGLSSQHM